MSDVVGMFPLIPRKELKMIKSMRPVDKVFNFTFYAYNNREKLVGEADLSVLDYFLANIDIDLNTNTKDGYGLIYFAIESHAPAVLDYLIRKGVSLEVKHPLGYTPIEFAEYTLNRLLENGHKDNSHLVVCAEQSVNILKEC